MNCLSLTEITIPSSVFNIEKSAFENCQSLNNIKFEDPTSLKNIGDYAFKGCHYIQNDIKELNKICGNNFDHCFDKLILIPSKLIIPDIKKNDNRSPPYMKLVFIGKTLVGKTCVSRCFCDLEFIQTEKTIGGQFFKKEVMINDIKNSFGIWDTSGDDRFLALIPMYLTNANIIIIVFDITDRETFDSLDYFLNVALKKLPNLLFTILVGNKCDMERKVSKEEIEQYAFTKKLHYFEVSALTKQGFEELIEYSIPQAQLSYFYGNY